MHIHIPLMNTNCKTLTQTEQVCPQTQDHYRDAEDCGEVSGMDVGT